VALPRFFDRVSHAVITAAGPVALDGVAELVEKRRIRLVAPDWIDDVDGHRAGFLMSANLLARVYPSIGVDGPHSILGDAVNLIRAINPDCDVDCDGDDFSATLHWGQGPVSATEICVCANAWSVLLDSAVTEVPARCSPLAAMAAAAIGVGEVFRAAVGGSIGNAREGGVALTWDLVTLSDRPADAPCDLSGWGVGELTLVGCGAIGQAFVAALVESRASGHLVAFDPEEIELSNLQRYVLATNGDVAEQKTSLVARALSHSTITVEERPCRWSLDGNAPPPVLVCALDTERDRIDTQASLPRAIYNAYTGNLDLGWSRHERFGEHACLACLYWPTGAGSSSIEQIARSLDMEADAKRVALYRVSEGPIGQPLPPAVLKQNGVDPETAVKWSSVSLLADIVARFELGDEVAEQWSGKDIDDLYTEGLCGGALVELLKDGKHDLLVVPLAHHSVLAGVMLAVSVLCGFHPQLRVARHADVKAALRVAGSPDRPYTVTPAPLASCMCTDDAFRLQYEELWG